MVEPTRGLLARVLEDPALLSRVQALDARTFGRIVQHVGLEDAGEIVALATTEQLRDMFDEDLWVAPEPGEEEKFDARRFALWLEILCESGEQFAANKLIELPEELVTLALQQQVLVIDIDALALEMSERRRAADLEEKALESCLYEELDQYRIISRQHDHWDVVLSVLLELDQNHHSYLSRLLERCCDATTEYIDDNGGLYDVLTSEEMLEADASGDRDDRRSASGFVSSNDAAAFLAFPRVQTLSEVVAMPQQDAVTSAYFRSFDRKGMRGANLSVSHDADQMRFTALLNEAGIIEQPAPLLPAGKTKRDPAFQRAMAFLRNNYPEIYVQRAEELGYLANVLVAGASFAGRTFRPVEAADAAIRTCNIGLLWLRSESPAQASAVIRKHSADHMFRIGWHILFHEVLMRAAEALVRRIAKRDAPPKLVTFLDEAIAEQKPWKIRTKLRPCGVLLDPKEQRLFQHFIDRCPTIPPKKLVQGVTVPARFFTTLAEVERARVLLDADQISL